jgi:hypothetical protein
MLKFIGAAAIASAAVMLGGATASAGEPARPCRGGHEGFALYAATPRTTCAFARATGKKVRYLAFHNQGRGLPHRFALRVRGRKMSCVNTHINVETIICQGRQRKVVLEYAV